MEALNKARSARIVEEATRIIELTSQIDQALEAANVLTRDRRAALLELARLTGDGDASEILEGVNFIRTVSDAILIAVMRAGPKGVPMEDLKTSARARIDVDVSDEDLEAAIGLLLGSNEIKVRGDGYVPGAGKGSAYAKSRRRRLPGKPTNREMILEVLRDSPVPLGVAAIIKAVNKRYGAAIPRTNVSPLLAKLNQKGGTVVHVGDGLP